MVNPRLAESQVLRRHHHGHLRGSMKSAIMDQQTGECLNPDMEFYKLAGIADVGDILVHLDIRPENDKRGVIGLGRAAGDRHLRGRGNAVANAIGVRVPHIPMTPDHVLDALEGRNA